MLGSNQDHTHKNGKQNLENDASDRAYKAYAQVSEAGRSYPNHYNLFCLPSTKQRRILENQKKSVRYSGSNTKVMVRMMTGITCLPPQEWVNVY